VTTALLFDRAKVDEVEAWESLVERLRRSSLLWIDVDRPDESEARAVADALELSENSRERLASSTDDGPFFGDFGSYIHITAYAPGSDGESPDLVKVECLVSERWVVTAHEQGICVLDDFRERVGGSGETGRLDGLQFLATLLEWVLHSYLDAFEEIESALGDFDTRAMEGRLGSTDDELRRLVEVRRRVGRLRAALVSHREMLLALTRPELGAIASSTSAERFAGLRGQLEEIVQAARDSRDSIVGSFEVLTTLTEHRTNETVKVLTLTSVLLLPGALIAGIMGMNFRLDFFDDAIYFWVVLGLMASLALTTLAAAKARRWI
jgi:magnesium transporter